MVGWIKVYYGICVGFFLEDAKRELSVFVGDRKVQVVKGFFLFYFYGNRILMVEKFCSWRSVPVQRHKTLSTYLHQNSLFLVRRYGWRIRKDWSKLAMKMLERSGLPIGNPSTCFQNSMFWSKQSDKSSRVSIWVSRLKFSLYPLFFILNV